MNCNQRIGEGWKNGDISTLSLARLNYMCGIDIATRVGTDDAWDRLTNLQYPGKWFST